MNKTAKNIFENLRGEWTLNRLIEDLERNEINTATGIARFSQANPNEIDTLQYIENGKLVLKDSTQPISFSRRYVYKLIDNQIDILLDDGVTKGQLFQRLNFENDGNMLDGSEHICRLDIYNGKYFFIDKQNFRIEYTVIGPKKNLVIKTDYRKAIIP